MGEAKKRGSFEERKAVAIARNLKSRKAKSLAERERIKNMSKEQWERRCRAMEFMSMLESLTLQ